MWSSLYMGISIWKLWRKQTCRRGDQGFENTHEDHSVTLLSSNFPLYLWPSKVLSYYGFLSFFYKVDTLIALSFFLLSSTWSAQRLQHLTINRLPAITRFSKKIKMREKTSQSGSYEPPLFMLLMEQVANRFLVSDRDPLGSCKTWTNSFTELRKVVNMLSAI